MAVDAVVLTLRGDLSMDRGFVVLAMPWLSMSMVCGGLLWTPSPGYFSLDALRGSTLAHLDIMYESGAKVVFTCVAPQFVCFTPHGAYFAILMELGNCAKKRPPSPV